MTVTPSNPKYNDLVSIQWWMTETLFWFGFGLTSFISLGLFYGNPIPGNLGDITFEAIIGVVFTRPILWGAPHLAKMRPLQRVTVLLAMILILSQLWNVVRMMTFPYFIPGVQVWDQFGGYAFTAGLIFSLWTALFYGVRAYNSAADQRARADIERFRRLNAEKLSSNAQLKMLRYQINPHFIFNTLNSVNALIATNRNKDARLMIDKFSDLLRLTLERDPPLIVPLADEIDTARRYLTVEQMRFRDRLTTVFEIDPDLEGISVPSLIMQPLIENAVRHGVEVQSKASTITIIARRKNDKLELVVADTGPGLNQDRSDRDRESLGVDNVTARLESVYGDAASFELRDCVPQGVKAILRMPLQPLETFS